MDISQGSWKRSQIKELHYKGSDVVFIKCRNSSYVEPLSYCYLSAILNCHIIGKEGIRYVTKKGTLGQNKKSLDLNHKTNMPKTKGYPLDEIFVQCWNIANKIRNNWLIHLLITWFIILPIFIQYKKGLRQCCCSEVITKYKYNT